MKEGKKLIIKYWDVSILAIITLFIFVVLFIPFFLTNSLDKFDTPGLLSLSWFIKEYTFPDFQGWNPYFYGGFPQGILYPPLFHYLVAFLGNFLKLEVAYKLIVTSAAIFIPLSLYEFSEKIYKEKPWAVLNTILLLILLIFLPGYLGFNFDGLFDYGLGPSFVSIPLFFIYLSKLFTKERNVKVLAILFSIMLLTNLVATFVAALITIVLFLLNLKDKRVIQKLLLVGGITFFLTSFWTIPFLIFRQYTASGFPMHCNKILSLIALFGTIATVIFIIRKRKDKISKIFLSILIPGTLIGILSLIDSTVNTNGTKIAIPPIHPFRLQIFAFLSIGTTLPYIIQSLHRQLIEIAGRLKIKILLRRVFCISFNLTLASLILFVLIVLRINPSGVDEVNLNRPLQWEGRIMRSYKVSEVLDQSRAVIDKSIMENPNNFAVDGLLKESSYLAPYFQSLAKSINFNNYNWKELDQYYIENKQIPADKAKYLMNLLWVKSLFTIDDHFPRCGRYKHLTSFKSNSSDFGIVKRDMYICSYTPSQKSNFVEILTLAPYITEKKWEEELVEWWVSDNKNLFVKKETEIDIQEVPQLDVDTEFSNKFQQLKININSDKSLPILIKVSYFPKWKAYDKEGNQIPISRISPNLMLINTKGETTLKYERTFIEWATLILSLSSWLCLIPRWELQKSYTIKKKVEKIKGKR